MPPSKPPGVYITEVDSGVRMITGAGTSTPAFIGSIPGEVREPRQVQSWNQFREIYLPSGDGEDFTASSYAAEAVYGFFANGGGSCYVVGTADGDDCLAAYQGNEDEGTGLAALELVPEVKIIVAPDLWQTAEDAPAIAKAIARHCADLGNRMAVLHTKQGLSATDAEKVPAAFGLDEEEAQFTSVYYPWVTTPGFDGTERLIPPSGHIAGVWARTDAQRGVQKAPANQNLQTVTGIEVSLSDDEQGPLNAAGVNCLRSFPGQGVLVWGARTLSDSSEWRYLNVRRLANFLRESIRTSTKWVVFEPNDERLQSAVRASTTSFLMEQWRSGALLGHTPHEAFYVICDESNNPPEGIADGKLTIDVGVAAVRPAEFITFRILQISGSET
ncbi:MULTISPECIES: phage tail sheath C-terminal domain-containing protein, partial [unclassified Streptomyces]|uniref:phage tail sheath family protein n=1 Tax=unclassified Streptomyces TaxID=2593676 RepID=UPI00039F2FD9